MTTVLIFSNATYGGYGYSTVVRNLSKHIKDSGNDVYVLSMQTVGDAIRDENGVYNLPIRYNSFASDSMADYLESIDPDVVITVADIWVDDIANALQAIVQKGVPWICHVTISHSPVFSKIIDRAMQSDIIVSPSLFNYNLINSSGLMKKSIHIPHGVNTAKFYPENKEKLKKLHGLDGKFVFMVVSRARWPQKNMNSILQAYKTFIDTVPTAKQNTKLIVFTDVMEERPMSLVLHRDVMNVSSNIEFVKCRITKDARLSFAREHEKGAFYWNANYRFHEDEMRRIYNLADCIITSSIGESFNLPCIESMACGIPQIAPDHSTGPELIGSSKSGILCSVIEPFISAQLVSINAFSMSSMVSSMKTMYSDHQLRETMSANAIKHAKKYSWENVFHLWDDAIANAVSRNDSVDYTRGMWAV